MTTPSYFKTCLLPLQPSTLITLIATLISFPLPSLLFCTTLTSSFKGSMAANQIYTVGPFGGSGGQKWDDGTYGTVRQLNIYAYDVIDAIQVVYDIGGNSISIQKRGGGGGTRTPLRFAPDEYITSISGYYAPYKQSNGATVVVVQSLVFKTNRYRYGPFGTEGGTYFSTPELNGKGKIVGFLGSGGWYLDSIGAHIELSPDTIRLNAVGSFGGPNAHQWDDGTYTTVRQLIIYHDSVVKSIQIEYDNNGKSQWSAKHGRTESGTKATVKLDSPDEFLLSVWGYSGTVDNNVVIRSIGFQSNKRTYGPFGVKDGEKFQFSSNSSMIIGFHGRSSKYLTSIGAYLAPFPNSKPSSYPP